MQILPYLTKYNKIQLYFNIILQSISCFVILICNNYLIYLEFYLIIISFFYTLILLVFLYSFLLIMVFENFKYIKDTYMTFDYKIKINNIEEYTEPLLEDNYISVTVI